MIHLGDITAISGYAAPPVDAVIGGSPCQDLSVAGKRAGLAGERSGLFMEQIRIIKEMREADVRRGRTGKFIRPRFMVWENVPGAFSSNKGDDFRAVLEETIRVAEPDAPDIPLPAKGKWPLADCWMGDGWSVAYRVLDAQFWGVPQRRRRIALVADFGGRAAPEILFVRQGLCWDTAEGGTPGEETAAGTGSGADCTVTAVHLTQDPITGEDVAPCLSAGNPVCGQASIGIYKTFQNTGRGWWNDGDIAATIRTPEGGDSLHANVVVAGFNPQARADAGSIGYKAELSPTIDTGSPHAVFDARGNGDGKVVCTLAGDHQNRVTDYTAIVMATGQESAEIMRDKVPTLNCNHEQHIVSGVVIGRVRRLTPLECERLQGYPDGWTDIGPWTGSAGKLHKESSDSARYKALGNSIALPPWSWVLKRLCACYERTATMASLFDGIGGFPLIWERLNGPGSCLWASEIEEFPIAVTKAHFDGKSRW